MKNNHAPSVLKFFATATTVVGVITAGDKVTDCLFENLARPNLQGACYLAKVQKIHAGGAFVDCGAGITGWLQTAQRLSAGSLLPVQISAFVESPKHWPLSTEIKLESATLIHLPHGKGVHVSASFVGDAAPLKQALASFAGGWIIRRTATQTSVQQDAAMLQAKAQQLLQKSAAPCCLLPPPTMAVRLQNLCGVMLPVQHITNLTAIDNELEQLTATLRATLVLSNGGRLIIQPTAALTTIDIDAGNSANAHVTNMEAAAAVAAAVRQFNLGGQIVVDFLRTPAPQRAQLGKAFAALLAADRLPVTAHGFTKMGLYELTRPRLGPSLLGTELTDK